MTDIEKDNFQYELGSYCQQVRYTKGYSRKEVAEVIDMSVDGLEKFEKGNSNIGVYYLTNLFAFLNIPTSILMKFHASYLEEAMQERINIMGKKIEDNRK